MSDRTLVVSATNLLARGFLVVPTDRRSRAGEPVNALFAVARGVRRALAFKAPTRAVAVIEAAPPAGWPPLLVAQLPALGPLLAALGLPVVEAVGEIAVAAGYARAALAAGDDVVVVGIDKRFAQLVGERAWWYDANKDARYTPDMVHKRFGVAPAQVADWLALVGDDDALPGIAGIGAKGATGLLASYPTVEAALAEVAAIPGRTGNALRAAGEPAVVAELARARLPRAIDLPRPLADLAYAPPAIAAHNAALDALGFVELLVAEDAPALAVAPCASAEEARAAVAALGAGPVMLHAVIDDGDQLRGLALAADRDGALALVYVPEPAWIAAWLADPAIGKLGHDLVATLVAFAAAGLALAGVVGDSACASHLTQPSNWAPHDLPVVAKHVLGRPLPTEDALRGVGAKRVAWAALPVERVADFAAAYAGAGLAVWRALAPDVSPALLAEYLALTEVVVGMERHGLAIDLGELAGAEADFAVIEAGLLAEIEALAGHAFNVGSSKQLGEVLFAELGLPVVSHTKTGWSTANEALERIEHAHPIVALVIRWRGLRRLRDSWIASLRGAIAADGRVHSRFHPARSFSGRLVNTHPDLGRVPGRTPEMARIRRAFVASPGCVLMSIDYNQLGLHVLAHLTGDPALVEPLRAGADLHTLTAAAVLERPVAEIGERERQIGKVVNFATFAGQGANSLALQLGVPAAEARELIARFDRTYAQVRAFQDTQLAHAHDRGYIETLAGRRWPIGGLASLDSHDKSYAERLARRATHEGSVSDVARRGLLDAATALRRAGLVAMPLAQILDEVLFEVPRDELATAAPLAAAAMRDAFALAAPLRVGIEVGPTWADLAPLAL